MKDYNFYIGVDAGASFCKAIALNSKNNEIKANSITFLLGNPEKAANKCLDEIGKKLNVKLKILKKNVITTGQNGDKIRIGQNKSEITCIGRGVYALDPTIRIIVDVGSFSMKVLKIDESGKIKDYLMNNKCAAGSGVLLELVAEGLEMRIDELNDKAFQAKKPIQISSQCSIFAESEVISYKNEGANIPDLVAGVCNSVAGRIYPLIRMIDKETKKVAFSGGVAKNKYIAQNLEERLGFKLVKLSLEPEYVAAYGAAIIVKEGGGA